MEENTLMMEITEENAPAIYVAGGLQQFVDKVREEVAGEVPDLSTKKGRDRVASLAAKVSRSKSAVEKPGRDYLRKLKAMPKVIEGELREFVAAMDALRDEVREPLNRWEAAEKARTGLHEAALARIESFADCADLSSEVLVNNIAHLESLGMGEQWEEYSGEAERARDRSLEALRAALPVAQQREAEQAELARLRKEAEEREKKDREDAIAREAAEKAQQEQAQALAKAKADAELSEQRRIAAEEQAEKDRIAAAEKAEADRVEAERKAAEAAEHAAAQERQRIADEQAKAEAERLAREADLEHKGKINSAALAAIQAADAQLTKGQAKAVLVAIIKGQVPAVTINY